MLATYNLTFPKGYIAHPYWPEQERYINITKQSGVNRARSQANREKALKSWLEANGMTVAELEELKRRAERPFYTAADPMNGVAVKGHEPAEIVIPPHQWYGALANGCDLASSALRVTRRDQLRSVLEIEPCWTGKTEPDGTWERFVTVTGGGGAKLSNQRALRSNPYLGPFEAELRVAFSEEIVQPKKVADFIAFVGREIGIGACRKMGWGRFEIS